VAVQHLNDQWLAEHPGREPTEADIRDIAKRAWNALEEELPDFSEAWARATTIEFIMEELRAWELAHPGEDELPEDEKRRFVIMAKARVMAGHKPGRMM
jgi:hypothetical protein